VAPGKKAVVVSVVGARPQFVKLAPLARQLNKKFKHIIIHSGQHYDYDLSDAFFTQLKIPIPDQNLNIGSGNHGMQTGRILEKCEKELLKYRPGMVLVYGDTNTTLAGALAASKLGLPIGHVEAGLRSFRRTMPEEINRKMTDHISDILFCPTATARKNLKNEGIKSGLVQSGDLMYELLDSSLPLLKGKKKVFCEHGVEEGDFVLITLHRAENVDDPERLQRFLECLDQVPYRKLFLAHPRTVKNMQKFKLYGTVHDMHDLRIGKPQPYLETLALMAGARAVMTDSGGIQKEAFFLGRPCLTLRSETEWIETVKTGANFLVNLSPAKIRRAFASRLKPRSEHKYKIGGKKPSAIITAAVEGHIQKNK
jgi:UDP-N-acetylglucosamine 2-epimerase